MQWEGNGVHVRRIRKDGTVRVVPGGNPVRKFAEGTTPTFRTDYRM